MRRLEVSNWHLKLTYTDNNLPLMDSVREFIFRARTPWACGNTLKLAAMGFQNPGFTYRGRLSPGYMMQWKDIIVVKCMEPGNKQNGNNVPDL